MFDQLYKELGMDNKYSVWYKTPKREHVKYKGFNSIEEVRKWCKANKKRVKLHSGSWQVLDIMRELKS